MRGDHGQLRLLALAVLQIGVDLEAQLVRACQTFAFRRHSSVPRCGERREIGLAPHAREPVIARRWELLRQSATARQELGTLLPAVSYPWPDMR